MSIFTFLEIGPLMLSQFYGNDSDIVPNSAILNQTDVLILSDHSTALGCRARDSDITKPEYKSPNLVEKKFHSSDPFFY